MYLHLEGSLGVILHMSTTSTVIVTLIDVYVKLHVWPSRAFTGQ